MTTKRHLTAERDDLRDALSELLESLPGLNEYATPESKRRAQEAVIRARAVETALAREAKPEYALTTATRVPRRLPHGVTSNDWRHERLDGLPISQSLTEVCDSCGCRVALLSARRRHGGYYTARLDFDGFKHNCERQQAVLGEAKK